MPWQMPLDRPADEAAQPARVDSIELDGLIAAEFFGARVGLLGRSGWEIPIPNLIGRYRDALEMNLGGRRQLTQRLFDLLAGIDAGGIEVAQVIDISWDIEAADEFRRG